MRVCLPAQRASVEFEGELEPLGLGQPQRPSRLLEKPLLLNSVERAQLQHLHHVHARPRQLRLLLSSRRDKTSEIGFYLELRRPFQWRQLGVWIHGQTAYC